MGAFQQDIVLLNDNDTYNIIRKNPICNIERQLNTIVKEWLAKGWIEKRIYYSLFSSDSLLPRTYDLPKIHKKGYPLRIIVSSINTVLHLLASFLHDIISNSIVHNSLYVENNFDIFRSLSNKELDKSEILVSLDVCSLFMNIPLDLALESVSARERDGLALREGQISHTVNLLMLSILSSTFFTFNNKIYKQTFGTPMGSPLSPIIADVVMQDLELKTLNSINLELRFYLRYVDDILLVAPSDRINEIVDTFNNLHLRLRFTVEFEYERFINFLDVSLNVIHNNIVVDWYQRLTFSGRYLSFLPNHPTAQKIGVIYNLVDRAYYYLILFSIDRI